MIEREREIPEILRETNTRIWGYAIKFFEVEEMYKNDLITEEDLNRTREGMEMFVSSAAYDLAEAIFQGAAGAIFSDPDVRYSAFLVRRSKAEIGSVDRMTLRHFLSRVGIIDSPQPSIVFRRLG